MLWPGGEVMTPAELLQTDLWRKFQRRAQSAGYAPADLLAEWMAEFLAAQKKAARKPPAQATEAQLRARQAALQEACGLWADRPESAAEIARQIREANRRVT